MTDIVSPLLQWLNTHPQLAGVATFTISAAESVAIIGTIVPGSIMMTAIGALAGAGVIPLWETILWAILGAIVGDGISYWIGYHFKDRLPYLWPFRKYPTLLKTGEMFFYKYGSMSVFIGRFVGPVRALVPLVAGMLGMKPWKFIIANVTSAIGWAPAYMLPGILLGAASLELPPDIAIHVILVLLFIILFILLCLWFVYKLLQLINNQITAFQNQLWTRLKKSRYLHFSTFLLQHGSLDKTHGQLTLAFYCLLTGLSFIALVIYVKMMGPANIMVNEAVFHFFRGIRTDTHDNFMIFMTLLGQKEIILPVVLMIVAWLLLCKHWRAAFHALLLGILASGCVFVFKNLIKSPRPWGILQVSKSFSMPSGHAILSLAVYMGLAFLIARSLPRKQRWPVYAIAITITLMIGMSRLYLGSHWFTDVLAGWLLSATLLMLVIISFQRQIEKPINPIGILSVALITLMFTYPLFYLKHFSRLKVAYSQINWPIKTINMSDWWGNKKVIPATRSSLFGFPSQRINIEWEGNIQAIKKSLENAGWAHPPKRDFISIIHRLADVSSTQYLPLVSPQYLDKKPELIFTRSQNGEKGLLVLRLWPANRVFKIERPLWVGIVGYIPRSYSWIFMKHPGDLEIKPELVFPQKIGLNAWETKIVDFQKRYNRNHILNYKILFIRTNPSNKEK